MDTYTAVAPTTEGAFEFSLLNILAEPLGYGGGQEGAEILENVAEVTSFEDAGVMTKNKGLVIRLANGAEFQVTIVQSMSAAAEYREDEEVTR